MQANARQSAAPFTCFWIMAVFGCLIWGNWIDSAHADSSSSLNATFINFTDEEPDFVPPPPRDEDEYLVPVDGQDADGPTPEPTLLEDEVPPPGKGVRPDDLPAVPAPVIPEPPQVAPAPLLPPDRSHYDPGWSQGTYRVNTFQILPSGLMFRSYLAGEKESRISASWMKDVNGKMNWETTLGGRVGVLRYGTIGAVRPRGWQLDMEGAALPRIFPGDPSSPLQSCDYRFGILSTWAIDKWHIKTGYYHLSSHAGDEFLIANPGYPRLNYVRDSAILGMQYDVTEELQTYGEVAYAFNAEDGAKPLELQYGLQYSPMNSSLRGAPFAAINGHTRQDFGYITSVNLMAGWQWRGAESQHLWRMGLQYYKGPSLQYEFAGKHDRLLGGGIWFDF